MTRSTAPLSDIPSELRREMRYGLRARLTVMRHAMTHSLEESLIGIGLAYGGATCTSEVFKLAGETAASNG